MRARALAALAAALACALPAAAQREGERTVGQWRYEYEVSPPDLAAGGTALLILKIEGMSSSSLRLDALRLSPGLGLETQATRPYVMEGGAKGAELRLGFVLKQAGTQRIESLSLVSAEGALSLGPISMVVGESRGAASRPALWAWEAPASAYRYEAFPVGLERADGGKTAKGMSASFKIPADATVEASGYLRWTAVALKEGRLSLPDASIDPGRGSSERRGEAEAVQVRIKALPKEVAASRAIGDFALGLSDSAPARLVPGERAEFTLLLKGSGNFPCLILPEPELLLDGAPLGKEAWTSKRRDEARPSASGYSGSASLSVSVAAPRAGKLVLRFPPLPTLKPDGSIRVLTVKPIAIEVAAPDAAAPDAAAAATLGPAQPPADQGAALAALYGTMRRALPFERSYREADAASRAIRDALARQLAGAASQAAGSSPSAAPAAGGAGEPALDALPPPKAFIALAIAAIVAAAAAWAVSAARRRGRGPSRGLRPPVAALVLAAAAIASGSLALASALERREAYAVVWTDRVSVIPSPLAELEIRVPLGSTARLRLEALGFAGLAFSDGVEAWAPSESVFPY